MDLIFILLALLITSLSDIILRIIYSKYHKIRTEKELSGKQVAEEILKENDLENIKVNKIGGTLTDYYYDRNKTVNLSYDIYEGKSIASCAVAAHECGHAIQYKTGYLPIKIRNFLVPIVNFSNKVGYLVILIGLISTLEEFFRLGLILISFALLFELVTLPVEINASKRASKILYDMNLIDEKERTGVKIMLTAAAFTYVAGLFSSILQILRLVYIFGDRDRNE